MIIQRAKNPRGWTTIPNATFEDGSLTFKARGLLGYLLSRPEDWQTDSVRLANSQHSTKDGRDAIRAGLRELEAARYLVRVKSQGDGGRWSTTVLVYDLPQEEPGGPRLADVEPVDDSVESPVDENPETASPRTGFPASVNPALLTTTNNQYQSLPSATTDEPVETRPAGESSGSALLSKDAAGGGAILPAAGAAEGSGSALAEKAAELPLSTSDAAAIRAAGLIEPRIQMFALRAHLVEVLARPVNFTEVLDLLSEAHHRAANDGRSLTALAVVVLAVQNHAEAQALTGFADQERPGSAR